MDTTVNKKEEDFVNEAIEPAHIQLEYAISSCIFDTVTKDNLNLYTIIGVLDNIKFNLLQRLKDARDNSH